MMTQATRRRAEGLWAAMALLMIAVSSCGGDDENPPAEGALPTSSPDGGSASVAVEQFLDDYVQAACGAMITCCPKYKVEFVRDECERVARAGIVQWISRAESYDVPLNPAGFADCIAAIGQFAKSCGSDEQDYFAWELACQGRIFLPTVAVGSPCKDSIQCGLAPASGRTTWCNVTTHVCDPTIATVIVGEGEECRPSSDDFEQPNRVCRSELYCSQLDGKCHPDIGQGALCHDDDPTSECAAGLVCTGKSGDSPSTCEPTWPVTGPCAEGIFCAPGVSECIDNLCVPLEEDYGACSDYAQCRSRQCINGVCAPTFSLTYVCGGEAEAY